MAASDCPVTVADGCPVTVADGCPVIDLKEFEAKTDILVKLTEQTKSLPAQGSAEWLQIRQFVIGGSEISALMGRNPWKSRKSLIAEKCAMTGSFIGSDATRWGKLFEAAGMQFLKILFAIQRVFEFGSLDGVCADQRYSPDGLAVMRLLWHRSLARFLIVLFELKSPLCSLPTASIPKHYEPQIKTGLLCVPADLGLFVTNVFRKCQLSDLLTDGYDRKFHVSDSRKSMALLRPLAIGAIILKYDMKVGASAEEDSDEDDPVRVRARIRDIIDKKPMSRLRHLSNYDFGKDVGDYFSQALSEFDSGLLRATYIEPLIIGRNLRKSTFIDSQWEILPDKFKVDEGGSAAVEEYVAQIRTQNRDCVGIIPWKLFVSEIIPVEPDGRYAERVSSLVSDSMCIIRRIQSAKTRREKISEFYSHFVRSGDAVDAELSSEADYPDALASSASSSSSSKSDA